MNSSQAASADAILDRLIANPQSRRKRRTALDLYLEERAEKITQALRAGNTIAGLAASLHATFEDVSQKTLSRKIARLAASTERAHLRDVRKTRSRSRNGPAQRPSTATTNLSNTTTAEVPQTHAGLRDEEDL